MSVGPAGPVSVNTIVSSWELTPGPGPTNAHPVATELRLAPGTFIPTSQTFPAANSTNFPLSKFLGVSRKYIYNFTTVGSSSWTATFTGSALLIVVGGGGGGGPGAPTNLAGGGGGAGGAQVASGSITIGSVYPYTIGAGGSGAGLGPPGQGGNSFFPLLGTVTGGGFGGGAGPGGINGSPSPLGSGGGGAWGPVLGSGGQGDPTQARGAFGYGGVNTPRFGPYQTGGNGGGWGVTLPASFLEPNNVAGRGGGGTNLNAPPSPFYPPQPQNPSGGGGGGGAYKLRAADPGSYYGGGGGGGAPWFPAAGNGYPGYVKIIYPG
jgi:hypothetical protein